MLAAISGIVGRQGRTTGKAATRRVLHPAALIGAFAAAVAVLVAVGAAALAGTASAAAIALDAPDNGAPPLIAYGATTGTTYVAWSAPSDGVPGLEGGVDLCVLPAGSTACEGGAPVLLEDTKYPGYNSVNVPTLGGLVVLPDGEVVVVGTPVSEGSIAWASSAGGAAFLTGNHGLQNSGKFISPVSLYYTPNNAVALGTSDVGLFDSYDHFYSEFSDSPFAGPETPTSLPLNKGTANNGGSFDDQHDELGPVIAAEPAPAPAPAGTELVVGVGANVSSSQPTPPGCINDAATGYGVDVGTTGASGTLNSQGLQPNGFTLLACSADAPVLASGGGAGIGVIEQEGSGVSGAGSDYNLDYRPFAATSTGGSFGAPVELEDVTGASLGGIDNLDASEDAGDGVYISWQDEQGLVLDYSPDAGLAWDPSVVAPVLPSGAGNPTIAGVSDGIAEVAYESNPGTGDQVFLEAVNLIPPTPTTIATSQTSGTTSGASITIPAGTVGETDQAALSGSNATIAGGTVRYMLYSSSSCTGAAAFTSTASVTAGKVAASAPITAALAAGTYYWQVAYSGDSRNQASKSACGSEVLTVSPAPSSEFKVEAIVTSSNGTITITIVVTQSGKATLTVTVATTVAESAAVDAKHHKGCKHGQIKLKGKCLPATTVVGKTSAKATAGVPLKLTVHLSNKIKNLLKKGKTVHLKANLTFQSALGGKPTTHTYNVTVKGRRKGKHKK